MLLLCLATLGLLIADLELYMLRLRCLEFKILGLEHQDELRGSFRDLARDL